MILRKERKELTKNHLANLAQPLRALRLIRYVLFPKTVPINNGSKGLNTMCYVIPPPSPPPKGDKLQLSSLLGKLRGIFI